MSNGTSWDDCFMYARQSVKPYRTKIVPDMYEFRVFQSALSLYLRSLGLDNDTVEAVDYRAAAAATDTHARAFRQGWDAGFDQGRKS